MLQACRGGPRQPSLWMGVAAGAIVVTLGLAGCSAGAPSGAGSSSHAGSNGAGTQDIIAALFPATSAEQNSPQWSSWHDFQHSVQAKSTNDCLGNDGFSGVQVPQSPTPGAVADNSQYPDVARLESGSFGPAPSPARGQAGTGIPVSDQAAYVAARSRCEHQADALFDPLYRLAKPLELDYGQSLAQVYASPQVRRAWSQWTTCVGAHGLSATTQDAFWGMVDAEQARGGDGVAHLARVYGICVAPVAKVMDRLRLRARTVLLSQHALEVQQLTRVTARLAADLSRRYGVGPA